MRICPECNAPLNDDWSPGEHGCWYWNQLEERLRRAGKSEDEVTTWRQSGADAPCYGYQYDYNMAQQSYSNLGIVAGFALFIFIFIVVIMIDQLTQA